MSKPVWVILGRLPDPDRIAMDEEWLASGIVYTVQALAERQRIRLQQSVGSNEERRYEVREMVLDDERTVE